MNTKDIKSLREKTGAGILDCKNALQESGSDIDKALQWLKKKGLARAQKKSGREASEGRVAAYAQGQGRVAVLVEVNIETDFAARSEDFTQFVNQLSQHILAMNPLCITSAELPEEARKEEKKRLEEQAGSTPDTVKKGLEEWVQEVCLMEQNFIGSPEGKAVEACVQDMIAKLGENIQIRRFVRWELGN